MKTAADYFLEGMRAAFSDFEKSAFMSLPTPSMNRMNNGLAPTNTVMNGGLIAPAPPAPPPIPPPPAQPMSAPPAPAPLGASTPSGAQATPLPGVQANKPPSTKPMTAKPMAPRPVTAPGGTARSQSTGVMKPRGGSTR